MSGEMVVVALIIAAAVGYSAHAVWKSFRGDGGDCGCGTCEIKKSAPKSR